MCIYILVHAQLLTDTPRTAPSSALVVILVLISLGLNIHTIVGLVDLSPLGAPCTTHSRPHDELHEKKGITRLRFLQTPETPLRWEAAMLHLQGGVCRLCLQRTCNRTH